MKILPLRIALIMLIGFSLAGCVTTEYRAPTALGLSDAQTTRILDSDIERVWQVVETFHDGFIFTIENIDRQEGIVSGKFTADPCRYVDGGQLVHSGDKRSQDYAEYLLKRNLKLSGLLDLKLSPIDKSKTQVSVNVQYTVQVPGESFENAFTGELVTQDPTTWFFDSKGHASQVLASDRSGSNNPDRIFTSNGELERQILDELQGYLN